MANALQRDIKKGEIVVVKAQYLRPEFKDVEHRLFKCVGAPDGGFGSSAATNGNAVFGKWLATGEKDRIEGFMISKAETESGEWKSVARGLKKEKKIQDERAGGDFSSMEGISEASLTRIVTESVKEVLGGEIYDFTQPSSPEDWYNEMYEELLAKGYTEAEIDAMSGEEFKMAYEAPALDIAASKVLGADKIEKVKMIVGLLGHHFSSLETEIEYVEPNEDAIHYANQVREQLDKLVNLLKEM